MNLDNINKWLTLSANAGVLVGIIFLSLEIQQSNRIATANTEIEIRNNFSSVNESIYSDPYVSDLLVKLGDHQAILGDSEKLRFGSFIRRMMNVWLAIETAYENDMAPEETYNLIEDDIRGMFGRYPAGLPIWREVYGSYPALQDTQTFVLINNVLQEKNF